MLRPGVRSRGSRHACAILGTTLHNGLIVDRPVFEPFELGLLFTLPDHLRLTKCARLYAALDKAEKLSGVTLPAGSAFHMLRHSHAMWRRLFADADTAALVASGLWKSRNAASVYERLDLSAESRKSELFPTPTRAKGGQ